MDAFFPHLPQDAISNKSGAKMLTKSGAKSEIVSNHSVPKEWKENQLQMIVTADFGLVAI